MKAVGIALFETVCRKDMEGIVAKLATGRYEPDATTWVKIKNRPTVTRSTVLNSSRGARQRRRSDGDLFAIAAAYAALRWIREAR